MARFTILTAALFAATSLINPALAQEGYTTTSIEVAHRDRSVDLHLWYPTDDTNAAHMLGANPVFTGVPVQRSAAPAQGTHPLVVLSHGSGGNAANLAWIAADLAARGFVVAAPNHPGTTSRDSQPHETIKIWQRPADLSAIIDHALSGGLDGITVDKDAIAALGFSLGGYSVLGLGGATVSKSDYIDYCDHSSSMLDCGWLKSGGVDLTQTDQTLFEQSNRDPRLSAVVSVDPALSQAYVADSLAQMALPVQLINLGIGAKVPAAVDAANLVDHFGNAQLHQISGATHFSFLGECTPIGAAIIADESEQPICTEFSDRTRADIHTELRTLIGDFLIRTVAKGS